MSSVFDLFGAARANEEASAEKKLLNSEMDDIETPADAEFPSSEKLLALTTTLDKKVEKMEEETPLTARPDTPELKEADLGEELLSVTSDVNMHSDQINGLSLKVTSLESKIAMLPSLDSHSRKVATEVSELKKDMMELKTIIKALSQSMNASQTAVAQKLADVERRAATKQLSLEPVVDSSIIPPAEIEMQRDSVTSTIQSSSKGKAPVKIVVADLTDF